jgi:hypothetical protein
MDDNPRRGLIKLDAQVLGEVAHVRHLKMLLKVLP